MYYKQKYYQIQRYANTFFYIAWSLMLINTCFFYSNMKQWSPPFLSEIAFVCFSIKTLLTFRWSLKEIAIDIFLLSIGVLTFIFSTEKRILWLAIALVAVKDIKIDQIIPMSAFIYLFMCLSFVLCFALGISDQGISMKGGMSFGLDHPNVCHNYFLLISCLYIYIYYGKIKVWHIILMLFLNWGLYLFTLSRSGALTFTAVLVYLFLIKIIKNDRKRKLCNSIFTFLLVFGALLITVLPIIYRENFIFDFINNLSTGRILQANVYYKAFGLHLFGEYLDILYEENPRWFLDIGYTKILINNGIIPYIFFMLGYCILIIKFSLVKQYRKILLLVMFFVNMYFENVYTYVFMNLTLLWFAEEILFCNSFCLEFKKKKILKGE